MGQASTQHLHPLVVPAVLIWQAGRMKAGAGRAWCFNTAASKPSTRARPPPHHPIPSPTPPTLQLKGMKHKGMTVTLKDGSTAKPSGGKGRGGAKSGGGRGSGGGAKSGGRGSGGGRGRGKK